MAGTSARVHGFSEPCTRADDSITGSGNDPALSLDPVLKIARLSPVPVPPSPGVLVTLSGDLARGRGDRREGHRTPRARSLDTVFAVSGEGTRGLDDVLAPASVTRARTPASSGLVLEATPVRPLVSEVAQTSSQLRYLLVPVGGQSQVQEGSGAQVFVPSTGTTPAVPMDGAFILQWVPPTSLVGGTIAQPCAGLLPRTPGMVEGPVPSTQLPVCPAKPPPLLGGGSGPQVDGAEPTPHLVERDGSEPRRKRSRLDLSELFGSFSDSESSPSLAVPSIGSGASPSGDPSVLVEAMAEEPPPVRTSVSVGIQVDSPPPAKCVTVEVAVQTTLEVVCGASSTPIRSPSGKRTRRASLARSGSGGVSSVPSGARDAPREPPARLAGAGDASGETRPILGSVVSGDGGVFPSPLEEADLRVVLSYIRTSSGIPEPPTVTPNPQRLCVAEMLGSQKVGNPSLALPRSRSLEALCGTTNLALAELAGDPSRRSFLTSPRMRERKFYRPSDSSFAAPLSLPVGLVGLTSEALRDLRSLAVTLSPSLFASQETMGASLVEAASWLEWWLGGLAQFRDHLPGGRQQMFSRMISAGSGAIVFVATQALVSWTNLALARRDAVLDRLASSVPVRGVTLLRHSELPIHGALFDSDLVERTLATKRSAPQDVSSQQAPAAQRSSFSVLQGSATSWESSSPVVPPANTAPSTSYPSTSGVSKPKKKKRSKRSKNSRPRDS